MGIPVFLSYPKPHALEQDAFVNRVIERVRDRGFDPMTLGVTDQSTEAALPSIRRLMLEANGLITIAFRRILVEKGVRRRAALDGLVETPLSNVWFTSPYSQIEPAMAYQIGLPILIVRERGVVPEGVLEPGAVGIYMPEFSLDSDALDYLAGEEWRVLSEEWEKRVRAVHGASERPAQAIA